MVSLRQNSKETLQDFQPVENSNQRIKNSGRMIKSFNSPANPTLRSEFKSKLLFTQGNTNSLLNRTKPLLNLDHQKPLPDLDGINTNHNLSVMDTAFKKNGNNVRPNHVFPSCELLPVNLDDPDPITSCQNQENTSILPHYDAE